MLSQLKWQREGERAKDLKFKIFMFHYNFQTQGQTKDHIYNATVKASRSKNSDWGKSSPLAGEGCQGVTNNQPLLPAKATPKGQQLQVTIMVSSYSISSEHNKCHFTAPTLSTRALFGEETGPQPSGPLVPSGPSWHASEQITQSSPFHG